MKAAGGILDLVLPLRVDGAAQPLFCVPPVIGLSWCYTGLFRHIGAEHPVYGLQSRGLRRPEPLPATMAEMARGFADQVRLTQPAGPYHLLGWSLGGIVAHAVAAELERRGDEVALLAVLDAYPEDPNMHHREQVSALYNVVLSDFGYLPVLVEGEPEPEARVLETIRGKPGLALDDWSDERVLTLLRVIRNNVMVARGHVPESVRCGLLYLVATRRPPALPEKVERWSPYIGGTIDVVGIDCLHEHMMLPGPAEQIGAALTGRRKSVV